MEGLLLSYLSVTSILYLAVLTLIGYLLLSWLFDKTPKNLPPGPRDWRSFLELIKATKECTLQELATKWAEEYGPIVYLSYLGQKTLFLNTAEVSRKMFNDEEFKSKVADRVTTQATKLMFYENKDMIFTKFDAVAKKKRKMFFSLLHMYGDGVERFDKILQEQMEELCTELDQHLDEDMEFYKPLARTLKAIFCILVLGEHPSAKTADMMEEMDIAFNKLLESGKDMMLTAVPILAKIPGKYKTAVDRLIKARREAENHIFHEPKKSYIPGKPRGFLDLMLEMQSKPGNEWLDDETIISFSTASFWAAHVTSRSFLLASFLVIINYPEVTKRIQEEVDDVIGDQTPSIEFKSRMPYTEAFLLEVLRVLTQSQLSSLRVSENDLQFEGYTIPKGTKILMNNWKFHHDEEIYDDPWTVKVERFLDDDGQLLHADSPARKNMLPFGVGLRSCPGEIFAKARIFMFVTSILQKYDVLPPANEPIVPADFKTNHDSVKGFVRQVQPYKVRIRRRCKAGKTSATEAA